MNTAEKADWDDFPPGGLHASSDSRKAMTPTADVEKIARKVGLELIGKSGSEVEAILAGYFTQVRAPLVEPLRDCMNWMRSQKRTPRMNELIGRADAALTGIE